MPQHFDVGEVPKTGFRVKYGVREKFCFKPIETEDTPIVHRQYFLQTMIKPLIRKENCHAYNRIIASEIEPYMILVPKGDWKHFISKELNEGDILLDVTDPPYYTAYFVDKDLKGFACTDDFIILYTQTSFSVKALKERFDRLCVYLSITPKPNLSDIITLKYLYSPEVVAKIGTK